MPSGVASPKACASWSKSASVAPPATQARRESGHAAHAGQVDHQPVVAQGAARNVVAAAAHRQRQAVVARKRHAGEHVGSAGAAHDQRRTAIDHRVPDRPGSVILRVAREQQGAP
jgi:hypothetical protein